MRGRDRHSFEANGDVYFITSTVVGFVDVFVHDDLCRIFIDCVDFCQRRGDFVLLAWVLMSNHFHLIVKRDETSDISKIVGNLKRFTSRKIGEKLVELGMNDILNNLKQAALQEPAQDSSVWKPRFDSLVITSESTLKQKTEYIHFNPVRKGLATEPVAWQYSSAAAYAGSAEPLLRVDTEWLCLGYSKLPSGKDS